MTLIVDASALFAHADRRSPMHATISNALDAGKGALVTTAHAAAECDYLVTKYLGVRAELRFLDDLVDGPFEVMELPAAGLKKAREVVARYADLRIGLTDASLVVLAERLGTTRILTLDERHFRAMEPLQGGHFTILPADA